MLVYCIYTQDVVIRLVIISITTEMLIYEAAYIIIVAKSAVTIHKKM